MKLTWLEHGTPFMPPSVMCTHGRMSSTTNKNMQMNDAISITNKERQI